MENLSSKKQIDIPNNIKIIRLGFVNAYLLEEKGNFILIDTGLPKMWLDLENRLIKYGCLPDKLKLVIATHGDFDHVGNCHNLQQKYQVPIALHQADQSAVDSGFARKRKIKHLKMRVLLFIAKLLKIYKLTGKANKFKADIYFHNDQDLQAYGFSAQILHVPGHTKGSVAVLTEAGDLFIGDTMVNFEKPEMANIVDNEMELKQSLEKLKQYNVKIVYPGHGRPFLFKDLII